MTVNSNWSEVKQQIWIAPIIMGLIVGFATQSVALGFAVGGIFLLYNLLYYRITSVTVVENQLSFYKNNKLCCKLVDNHEGWTEQSILTLNEELTKREVARC